MASARFRPIPMYINGRKIAEANGISYSIDAGDEQQLGHDGVLGLSDGIQMLKVDVDYPQPVAGTQIDFMAMINNKQEVQIQLAIGGKVHAIPMRITNIAITSTSKSGAVTGKLTLQNSGDLDVV